MAIKGYPSTPKTVGEHIRKRRIELGLRQEDVAKQLGLSKAGVLLWEGGCTPARKHRQAIKAFLGFDPFEEVDAKRIELGRKLREMRLRLRLTQPEVGRILGVTRITILEWEKKVTRIRNHRVREALAAFLSNPNSIQSRQDRLATVGEQIRRKRLMLTLSIEKLAKRLGVDPSTILDWELGRRTPKTSKLKILNQFLGVPG